jgi:hypothetical protein
MKIFLVPKCKALSTYTLSTLFRRGPTSLVENQMVWENYEVSVFDIWAQIPVTFPLPDPLGH